MPKYPDVKVSLSDSDGNVFAIIGKVAKALKRKGLEDAAEDFRNAARASKSYDDVLQLCMRTVDVT